MQLVAQISPRLKVSDNRLRQPCSLNDCTGLHSHLLHPCRSRHQPLMQSFIPGATHIQTYWVPEYAFICGVIPDTVWKNGCAEYMSSASIIYSKFNRIQSI